ncbi:Lrp/AsnC family transcriptional regulator [Roseivivax sp. CAU 1761]
MSLTKFDRIDVNILVELQGNGRMTNAQLADAVGLSPSPCLLRVKRLQEAGYIETINARVNLAKLGPTVTLFVEVTLDRHRRENFTRFEAALAAVPEVMECHLISGGYDYLVRMVVPRLSDFQRIMEELFDGGAGIARYFSYVVMKSPIRRAEYPIRALFDDPS